LPISGNLVQRSASLQFSTPSHTPSTSGIQLQAGDQRFFGSWISGVVRRLSGFIPV
jgi:hypothetical protein